MGDVNYWAVSGDRCICFPTDVMAHDMYVDTEGTGYLKGLWCQECSHGRTIPHIPRCSVQLDGMDITFSNFK